MANIPIFFSIYLLPPELDSTGESIEIQDYLSSLMIIQRAVRYVSVRNLDVREFVFGRKCLDSAHLYENNFTLAALNMANMVNIRHICRNIRMHI